MEAVQGLLLYNNANISEVQLVLQLSLIGSSLPAAKEVIFDWVPFVCVPATKIFQKLLVHLDQIQVKDETRFKEGPIKFSTLSGKPFRRYPILY